MKIPFIVAHRGLPYEAIENTIESFKLAFKFGADFIEGDFWLTKDNEIICIHDKNTSRITEGKYSYDISKRNLKEIKLIDYFSQKFLQNLEIPTFEEIIKIIPEGKGIFVEIKDNRSKFIQILKAKLNELHFSTSTIKIISYYTDVLKYAKQELPEIKTYWIFDALLMRSKCKNRLTFQRFCQVLNQISCDGFVVNVEANLNKEIVEEIHKSKFEICVYGVNDIDSIKQMIDVGIDYINTDYTRMVKEIFSQI